MSLDMPDQSDATSNRSFLAGGRKWAILVAAVLILVAAGVAAWQSFQPQSTSTTNTSTSTTNDSTAGTNRATTFQQVTVPLVADADKDGLPDQRETQLGTNLKLADSDGDQLGDYDEVEVYTTDPRKQDSDDDGYSDGEEVRSGNNPKGSGKLFDISQTLSNTNVQ